MRAINLLKRIYLWHLDGAVRYAPAVRLIRSAGTPQSRILEVGSGAYGITLFLPRRVTGCDVDFSGPDLGLLARVQAPADGGPLPFPDRSFDFVLAMDMLEHVAAAARPAILGELMRVADEWLLLSVPCGAVAAEYDRKLYLWLQARWGTNHRWLREHFQTGLPEARQIESEIRRCLDPHGGTLAVEDNFNVHAWLWAWKFHMSRNRFWRSFKNKLLWPLWPWFARRNAPPAYRKVFIVHKTHTRRHPWPGTLPLSEQAATSLRAT